MAAIDFTDLPLFAQRLPVDVACIPMAIPSQVLMRTCRRCTQSKPIGEYYPQKKGQRRRVCKECDRTRIYEARRVRIANDPGWKADFAAYHRDMRFKVKDECFKAYGGWICACCAEREQKFLTLDHIHNNGAEERRRLFGRRDSGGYRFYLYLRKHGYPSGYQILCMNCQHGKRMNQGVCPHWERSNDYRESEYSQVAGSAWQPTGLEI